MSWKLIIFNIDTEKAIKEFKREIKTSMDCVTNALQILGVIDEKSADIIRIITTEQGLDEQQIQGIFNYIRPTKIHKFIRFTNRDIVVGQLSQMDTSGSNVVFAGIEYQNGTKHVYVLERSKNGMFNVIEPNANRIVHCGKTPEEYFDTCLKDLKAFYLLCEQKRR